MSNRKSEPPTGDLTLRKKIAFSMVSTFALFFSLELGFRVLDVGVQEVTEDPFVGFSSTQRLFTTAGEGGENPVMQTDPSKLSWFNDQSFARQKKPGTKRVFALGGSTTFGRPFDDRTSFAGWLRALLPRFDKRSDWEVINAGGVSYASYRVVKVMEELVEYQPDLFVVLTGHNEFLERRTYSGLIDEAWTQDRMVAGARGLLLKSRVWNVLVTATGQHKPFTQERKAQLPQEVDEILNHSAGPEDYDRDEVWQSQVVQHFQYNINRMIDLADQCGAELIFISPASNLKDCSPFKSIGNYSFNGNDRSEPRRYLNSAELGDAAAKVQQTAVVSDSESVSLTGFYTEGRFPEALAEIDRELESDPRCADLHYIRGRCLFEMGDYALAREAFLSAVDEDVCPLRATRPILEALRLTCERTNCLFVDFDNVLGAISDVTYSHRCFGSEYFLDHVHPTITTHGLIAKSVIDELRRSNWLEDSNVSEAAFEKVAAEINAGIDLERQAVAFRNLAKVLHWAGKFEEAIPNAVDATTLLPDDLESWFVMADSLRQRGRDDEAYLVYEKLFQKGEYSRAYLPYGELLIDLGQYEKANPFLLMATLVDRERHRIRAFYDLGYSHLQLGQPLLALESLRECEQLAPNEPATIALIGEGNWAAGNAEEAIKSFQRLITINGEEFYANRRLAELYFQLGRMVEGQQCLDKCEQLDAGTVEVQRIRVQWLSGEE